MTNLTKEENAKQIKKLEKLAKVVARLEKLGETEKWKIEPYDNYDKTISINGRLILVDNDDIDHRVSKATVEFIVLARELVPDMLRRLMIETK